MIIKKKTQTVEKLPDLTFNEYQTQSAETIQPQVAGDWQYFMLGLCGEVGEIANEGKKLKRDDYNSVTALRRAQILDECGDAFYYLNRVVESMGATMEDVARHNLQKVHEKYPTVEA